MSWRNGQCGQPIGGEGGEDEVNRCDGYLLLVADPTTSGVECFGPYLDLAAAHTGMTEARRELDANARGDVIVTLARWHSS